VFTKQNIKTKKTHKKKERKKSGLGSLGGQAWILMAGGGFNVSLFYFCYFCICLFFYVFLFSCKYNGDLHLGNKFASEPKASESV